jgi:hypothetical protein
MSRDDAPDFKRVDTCFYCEALRPWNSQWDYDYCDKYQFRLEEKQAHVYVCKAFKHWREHGPGGARKAQHTISGME